jgi:hypothetical protein
MFDAGAGNLVAKDSSSTSSSSTSRRQLLSAAALLPALLQTLPAAADAASEVSRSAHQQLPAPGCSATMPRLAAHVASSAPTAAFKGQQRLHLSITSTVLCTTIASAVLSQGFRELYDPILAYKFIYPVVTSAGQELQMTLTHPPEKVGPCTAWDGTGHQCQTVTGQQQQQQQSRLDPS